jgi:hypothetical protein
MRRVRVRGLVKSPQYNGLVGTVEGEAPGDRFKVVLDEGGKELSLKNENLVAVEESRACRACSACGKEADESAFSRKQWAAKAHSRKCKRCVEGDEQEKGDGLETGLRHGSTPEQLEERMKSLDVPSRAPCVPKEDGIMVYAMLGCLGALMMPQLNAERAANSLPDQLTFDPRNAHANDLRTRTLVYRYVMAHIDQLIRRFCDSEAPTATADAQLVKRVLGRRASAQEKALVRSWSNHIEGDFWVVGSVDDGAVLVQLGDFHGHTAVQQLGSSSAEPWSPVDKEIVFVVKGLADPLSSVVRSIDEACQSCEGGPGFPVMHLTLLPSPDGRSLTYTSICSPAVQLSRSTPKQIHQARKRAEKAYDSALRSRRVYRTISASDTHVLRKTEKAWDFSLEYADLNAQARKHQVQDPGRGYPSGNRTALQVSMFCWSVRPAASSNVADPLFMKGLEDAIVKRPSWGPSGGCEGFKATVGLEVGICDGDKCRLCAEAGKAFGINCGCKAAHLKRVDKARRHATPQLASYFFDPPDESLGEEMHRKYEECVQGRAGVGGFCPYDMMAIGKYDPSDVTLQLGSQQQVETLRQRLHHAHLFHATSDSSWDYLSYFTFPSPQVCVRVCACLRVCMCVRMQALC